MIKRLFTGVSLVAALVAAAILGATALAQGTDAQVTGSVTVQDQTNDGTTVTVPAASISGSNGWVVIHADDAGAPGPVLGQTYIPEGENSNVTVEFAQALSSSQTLYAMVHEDNPADQQYTFPDNGDAPVTVDGEVVVKPFQYTLGAGTIPDTGGISLLTLAVAVGVALTAFVFSAGYLIRRVT